MTNIELLQQGIDRALLDGKLDDSERQELMRNAASSNISESVVLQLIMDRLSVHVNNKKICNRCHKPIENTLSTRCLCKASIADQRRSECVDDLNRRLEEASTNEQRLMIIRTFPLPTNQLDIVAMLSFSSSAMSMESGSPSGAGGIAALLVALGIKDEDAHAIYIKQEGDAWKSKAMGILENSKILYADDSSFLDVLSSFKKKYEDHENELRRRSKQRLLILAPLSVFLLLVLSPGIFLAIPADIGIGVLMYKVFSELQPVFLGLLGAMSLVVVFGWMRQRGKQAKAQQAVFVNDTIPTTQHTVSIPQVQDSATRTSQSTHQSSGYPAYAGMPYQHPMHQQIGQNRSEKSKSVALILCLLLGMFGIHRFYVGKYGTGLIMMFTAGGFYLWWIADVYLILTSSFKDAHGRPIV